MNKLQGIKQKFDDGLIDKWEYIDEMYQIHNDLFDFSEFMCDTNISGFEILDNRIIIKFRDSQNKFICTRNDKRLAPFETLNFGDYERDEIEMQLKLIEEEDTVLDIGGNFGWYAMHVGRYKPNAKILSFEPIPSTFIHLNENIKLNNFTNIETFNFGFSDVEGTFDFFFDPSLSVNASLANVSGNNKIESVSCSVKKLGDFIKDEKIKVDFIKCDVEGAELLVFKGGVDVIKKDTPIVFTEMLRKWTSKFNYHPNDIIAFFKELGYSCFILRKDHLYKLDTVTESTMETNYFFLHEEKHAKQIRKFVKS